MESYALLRSPLDDSVRHLFSKCQRSIFIASPFINVYGINALVSALPDNVPNINIEVLTSITVKSLQDGSLDLGALIRLYDVRPLTRVVSLPRLHAKVYAVDECRAIITSANFTHGGLVRDYEYGIALYDPSLVQGISRDMREYGNLGNAFTLEDLRKLAVEASELHHIQERAERAQRSSDVGKRLRLQIRELEDALLRSRVRERPITATFAETIRYLLRSGPMSTESLHARIKDIHPDICDDSIDRVINGQRFGKLWKHHVRNAQQFLKRRGEIMLQNGCWQLVSRSSNYGTL